MAKRKLPKYKSIRKKHPTPEEVMADMKIIGHKFGVYLKDCDPFSDYFAEKLKHIRSYYSSISSAYYYATRLESLAYRHERAKRYYAANRLKTVS